MKRTYEYALKATDTRDDNGQVGGLKHLEQHPRLADHSQAATVVDLRYRHAGDHEYLIAY